MKQIIGMIVILLVLALIGFHLIHHFIYCRNKDIPGKSHCSVCRHHKICQKKRKCH